MERTQANPSARIGAVILANIYYARNNLSEPIRDVKLVIISQEEQLLRGILRTVRERTKTRRLKATSAPFACPTHRTFYFVTADIYLFAPDASKLSDKLKISA